MDGSGKSDSVTVATKPANNAEPSAAELVEPRTGTKGNAKVTEVASSHVPMLSQPRRVHEVIRDAAVNIQR